MKLEDLGTMNALHQELNFLKQKRRDVSNSHGISLIYKEPRSRKDQHYWIGSSDVPSDELTPIFNRIKELTLKNIDAEIKEVEFKIVDL